MLNKFKKQGLLKSPAFFPLIAQKATNWKLPVIFISS